jgi:hypothetical protein
MSMIGNILFAPFLMVFLMLSSLLFFTQLFYIPNGFLATALNITTNLWETLLHIGQKTWLMSFALQHAFILLLIPTLTFVIISYKKINPLQHKVAFLMCLLISVLSFFSYNNTQYKQKSIDHLFIKKHKDNSLTIKDYGIFCRKKSYDTFVDFELKPYLIKNFGTMHIKNWIIKKPGISSIKGAQEVYDRLIVEKVLQSVPPQKLSDKSLCK